MTNHSNRHSVLHWTAKVIPSKQHFCIARQIVIIRQVTHGKIITNLMLMSYITLNATTSKAKVYIRQIKDRHNVSNNISVFSPPNVIS